MGKKKTQITRPTRSKKKLEDGNKVELVDDKPVDSDGMMADIMKELTGETNQELLEDELIETEEIQDDILGSEVPPLAPSSDSELPALTAGSDSEEPKTPEPKKKTPTKTEVRRPIGKETTYKERIREIIVGSQTGSMTLQEIYEKMEVEYPTICRKESREKWKNSVRHNLSLHKKTFRRFMLGQRSEWCVITSYDENDPMNPAKQTFSRENVPLNNNKGMPGRPPKRERSGRKRRREDEKVEIKIPVLVETYRLHASKKRLLFIMTKSEKARLEKYYLDTGGATIEQLQHERPAKTVLPAQFGKLQADRSTSPVIRFDPNQST